MDYEIVEGLTTADIAFRAYGSSLSDLFLSASHALISIMLKDENSIEGTSDKRIEMNDVNIEMLLVDFLNELLFYKDSELLLIKPKTISIHKGSVYELNCEAACEKINIKKHEFNVDIKAVTMHQLKIENNNEQWIATVIVDV